MSYKIQVKQLNIFLTNCYIFYYMHFYKKRKLFFDNSIFNKTFSNSRSQRRDLKVKTCSAIQMPTHLGDIRAMFAQVEEEI